jgi:hypothetical protein
MILPSPVKSKFITVLGLLSSALAVVAQTSTITYQGQLTTSGTAAHGSFDLRFALFDAVVAGNPVGTALTNAPTPVTNGLFTVTLDFGSGVFNGSLRWLEIGVRTNGSTNAYATLAPRQLLTATPYAIRAANYSGPVTAASISGKISDTNLSANVALLTNSVTFTGTVTASGFIGNGTLLNNLNATNLIGTIADARLSTNVALLNTSNAVFRGGISATNFYGYGGGLTNVPGRIFNFVPTTVSLTADDNYGYLAQNNATPVVVTLPPTAEFPVGNIVRVSGSGAAGWVIAQNAGQTILVANLLKSVGVNWTSSGGSLTWKAIAASADGSRLVAAVQGGQIYTSTDFGATWAITASSRQWTSVASSADGLKLVASVNGGQLYTSVNGGTNWTAQESNRAWNSVASSLDGVKLTATTSGASGQVFTSDNSGASWFPRLGPAPFSAVAMSGNGSNIVATIQGGNIQTSTNFGGNWTPRESNRSWTCVASSADGGTLVAGVNAGANFLYTSTDFGASWVPASIAASWAGVACSADGARMIAAANAGGVYVSLDSGVTWQQRGNLPTGSTYNGAACSGDGATMAAVAAANPIYVSSKTRTTVGATGQLIGSRLSAVELQHVGNGVFIPISYVGTIQAK